MTDEGKKEEVKEITSASVDVGISSADAEQEINEKPEPKKAPKQQKYTRSAKGKKRVAKTVPRGRAYINASLNNTIVTITDPNGNTLTWASAGHCGFRGPKRSTPYAASQVIDRIATKAEPFGIKELAVFVSGIGNGRDSAIRSLNAKGFNITSIKETTPVPHNGCRARRPRRM